MNKPAIEEDPNENARESIANNMEFDDDVWFFSKETLKVKKNEEEIALLKWKEWNSEISKVLEILWN